MCAVPPHVISNIITKHIYIFYLRRNIGIVRSITLNLSAVFVSRHHNSANGHANNFYE